MHKLKNSLSHDYTNSINNLMEILHFKIYQTVNQRLKKFLKRATNFPPVRRRKDWHITKIDIYFSSSLSLSSKEKLGCLGLNFNCSISVLHPVSIFVTLVQSFSRFVFVFDKHKQHRDESHAIDASRISISCWYFLTTIYETRWNCSAPLQWRETETLAFRKVYGSISFTAVQNKHEGIIASVSLLFSKGTIGRRWPRQLLRGLLRHNSSTIVEPRKH